ncbi:unnamed protein product, partial [Gulo gulo]
MDLRQRRTAGRGAGRTDGFLWTPESPPSPCVEVPEAGWSKAPQNGRRETHKVIVSHPGGWPREAGQQQRPPSRIPGEPLPSPLPALLAPSAAQAWRCRTPVCAYAPHPVLATRSAVPGLGPT